MFYNVPIYKDLKCDGSQECTHCNKSSIKSYAPPTFQWNLYVLVDALLCRLTKHQHFTHSTWIITTVKEKHWCDGSQECTQCNKSSIKPYAPLTFQWNLGVHVDALSCRLTKYQHFTHSAWIITTVKEKPWCDGSDTASKECLFMNEHPIILSIRK